MFKYDIHIHTMETSRCGYVRAAEMVDKYKALGYDGICITDHLHDLYIELMDCHDDWQRCVDRYMYGYDTAKKAGDAAGLNIVFGIELRFPENDSDYLIYGVDEAWLRSNPFVCHMDHRQFFERFGSEVLIIHAHPYRYCDEVFWDSVHGLEIANCNPRHPNRNELALKLAKEHPDLIRMCGSDAHKNGDEGRAAILFENDPVDSYGFRREVLAGRFTLSCPEYADIIKEGTRII